MKLSNLISNPVLTEGQIKNSLAMFQWLIDKEIESVDLYKARIKDIADQTETIEQFDVILRLSLASEYISIIAAGYTYHYGMEIPVPILWELHKKVTELIIKNWDVDADQIHTWRQLNVDYDEFSKRLNQSTRKLKAIQNLYIRPAKDQLFHYIDLMQTQPEAWKKLKSVRWGHKRIGKLLDELGDKHDEINRENAKKGIISQPKPHEDFLKINDRLKWVFIKDRFCPYEKEGMGHCATARQGCYLLSLREWSDIGNSINFEKPKKFEKPIWVPRITATVCEVEGGYLVTEILGPENSAPDKKWEGAIYKLYLDDRIVEQESRTSKTYSPEKLPPKKQVKVYEKKPQFETEESKLRKAIRQGSPKDILFIFISSFSDELPSQRNFIRDRSKLISDEFFQVFESDSAEEFFNFIDRLIPSDHKAEQKDLEQLVNWYEDPFEATAYQSFDIKFRDIDYLPYLKSMSKTQLQKVIGVNSYSDVEKDMIPENIRDLMTTAEGEGWRAGIQDGLTKYALNALQDIRFYNYDDNAPTMIVNFDKGVWRLVGGIKDAKRYLPKALSWRHGFTHYVFNDIKMQKLDDSRIPEYFNEEAAISYFQDLVTEEYGK